MPKFRESSAYRKLELVERFVPPLKKMDLAIQGAVSSIEYILFLLKELKPEIVHLEKNVARLKENVEVFQESLKRHGFEKAE